MSSIASTKRLDGTGRAISFHGCARYARWNIAAWCLTALLSTLAAGQVAVINREYAIKAGFLFQFSRYVTWPRQVFPAAGKPFVIGIYGADPFGDVLTKIALRKKVDGQPIEIRHVTSVHEVLACQILFIPKTVPLREQTAVLRASTDLPVLVVGETDDFVERGGNIQFFVEDNRVRFAIGEKSHLRDDLKVSSKLLTLARMIPDR
jgi:hypothetical protein